MNKNNNIWQVILNINNSIWSVIITYICTIAMIIFAIVYSIQNTDKVISELLFILALCLALNSIVATVRYKRIKK
ncbi:hypothetical protein [Clostridium estertheticum]|uniref:hypothetical protein n=1 Tax=Clostridium estertheticum TaxID=238834 RepID=UPI001C0C48FF|nr:hypothetical protein [Clostridium estertheticum]MBU3187606.1 hypothetical protein [Clostridium estertheticum]